MQINETTLEVVRGSVIDQDTDAIVNAANTGMRGGGGVDGAIHDAAGPGLVNELMRVAPHGAKTGTAVVTRGHNLMQKYIIHTPGPVWNGGQNGEEELLESCYRSCMERAGELRIASIAFCSISTGIYRFPLERAAEIAVRAVVEYLESHPETALRKVVFAMFKDTEYDAFSEALAAMDH
jgi:O-acetyl-ADP-ribose deacetylase (regulator of RNase III)